MKIFYRCSICGQFFSSEKECCEHEEHGHIKAIEIVGQELSNGKRGIYSLQKVSDPDECPF